LITGTDGSGTPQIKTESIGPKKPLNLPPLKNHKKNLPHLIPKRRLPTTFDSTGKIL
jgi:hypothetical protein